MAMTIFIILTLNTALGAADQGFFAVRENKNILEQANETIELASISEIHCAFQCKLNEDCCKSSYSVDFKTCKFFFNCCFRESDYVDGSAILTKRQHQDFMTLPIPVDCSDIPVGSGSGVYDIFPDGINMVKAYCEMVIDGGGWTVFQRRFDGSENFYQNWKRYKNGFGCPDKEYWLGNKYLSMLTSDKTNALRVELEDFDENKAFAKYDAFRVGSKPNFILTISQYHGNAGDAIFSNMKFSTYDKDLDAHSENCAVMYRGAWWYYYCSPSNLNGIYIEGDNGTNTMHWRPWHGNTICLKKSMMMIKYK